MRARLQNELFTLNVRMCSRFFRKYERAWVQTECWQNLEPVLRRFDLEQSRMTVVGYWMQECYWKLPEAWARWNAFVLGPKSPTAADRELLRSIRIDHPDGMGDGWDFMEVTRKEARIREMSRSL